MFSMTFKQWRESIARVFKPKPKVKHEATGCQLTTFEFWSMGVCVGRFSAMTRSEARAMFKRKFDCHIDSGIRIVKA